MGTLQKVYKKLTGQATYPPDFTPEQIDLIKKVETFTMTSPERLFGLLNAVEYVSQNQIEGAFVECGVWRGGSAMAMMYRLLELQDQSRSFYLYDTYEGMSEPTQEDKSYNGVSAEKQLKSSKKSEQSDIWAFSPLDKVKQNVQATNYPMDQVHFVKGKVEETIPDQVPEKIALLRLDTDWYESTKHEMEHLFPRLVQGGVIIIDDYGHWQGCRKAIDEYFTAHPPAVLLNRLDYTGRIGIKVF